MPTIIKPQTNILFELLVACKKKHFLSHSETLIRHKSHTYRTPTLTADISDIINGKSEMYVSYQSYTRLPLNHKGLVQFLHFENPLTVGFFLTVNRFFGNQVC